MDRLFREERENQLKVSYIRLVGPEYMTGALRATSGKDMYVIKEPSLKTFKQMALSHGGVAHSPLRTLLYRVYAEDVKSWVTVHYVRHHVGVQFYVKSQRTDRDSSIPSRDDAPQGTPISMMFDVNADAILSIAQARLCKKAAADTRNLMREMKLALLQGDEYDEILGQLMQPPCGWYDKCFEPKPCKPVF